MALSSHLEQPVADLEAAVASLQRRGWNKLDRTTPWWEQIAGTFESNPIYDKAMQLGRDAVILSHCDPRPRHAAKSRYSIWSYSISII